MQLTQEQILNINAIVIHNDTSEHVVFEFLESPTPCDSKVFRRL